MLESLFVSLPMVVCGIITLELALVLRQENDSPRRWLLVWAAVTTTLYACHFVFFHHAHALLSFSDMVYVTCNLAVYPLYLIYISQLADVRPLSSNSWKVALLLGPALLGGAATAIVYLMMTPEETDRFLRVYLYGGMKVGLAGLPMVQAVVHDVAKGMFTLLVVVVMLAGVRKVRSYNRKIDLLYADTEERSLHWINTILVLLVLTTVLSLVVSNVGRSYFDGSLLLALPSLAFASVLFSIGWLGLRRRPMASEIMLFLDARETEDEAVAAEEAKLTDRAPAESIAADNDRTPLLERVTALIEGEKLFLQNDLKLEEVATRLGTNRTYLIYALNEGMGMTFKEYVNRLRIAHAKRLMAGDPQLSKSQVSTLCGYSTPSSFYRNWNKYEEEPIVGDKP